MSGIPDTRNEKILSEQGSQLEYSYEEWLEQDMPHSDKAVELFRNPQARSAWSFLESPAAGEGWEKALMDVIEALAKKQTGK